MLPERLKKELAETLPPILNIQDICSILRVSWKTVFKELHRKGGLEGFIAEGEWNVTRADFLKYLSRNDTEQSNLNSSL